MSSLGIEKESRDRYERDPLTCNCNNVCRRSSGRGACPCKLSGRLCTKYCTCGTKKSQCTNQSKKKRGSDDSSSSDEEVNVSAAVYVPLRKTVKVAKKKHSKNCSELTSSATAPATPTTEDGAVNRANNVEADITTFLGGKAEGELRELCFGLLSRNPKEWETIATREDSDCEAPDWCFCGKCRAMPTERESVCCRHRHGTCVTNNIHFRSLIIDPEALDLAMIQRYDLLVLGDRPNNNSYRYSAYRSFIYWKAGRTGRYNRIVIPSCAVSCIRDRFPSEDGHYTGFKVGRF